MNTSQLKYFLSAARHLSFSETAKEFYMTQPAISHQISDLEQELGTRLFTRNARGVALTRAGELFLEDAKRFLDLELQSRERLQALAAADYHRLTIGYLASPCKYFLPEVIARFTKKYPQVDIELKRLDALGVLSSLDREQYDIYFSLLEDLSQKKSYHTRKIHEDNYCLICRKDHPCLSNFKIDYGKLATEPFLIFAPDKAAYMNRQIHQVCRDLNISPRVVQTYTSMEEILFAVEAGLGITILPYKTCDYLNAALVYVPLDSSNTSCAIGAAWHDKEDNPAVNWFMTVLNQYLLELSSNEYFHLIN